MKSSEQSESSIRLKDIAAAALALLLHNSASEDRPRGAPAPWEPPGGGGAERAYFQILCGFVAECLLRPVLPRVHLRKGYFTFKNKTESLGTPKHRGSQRRLPSSDIQGPAALLELPELPAQPVPGLPPTRHGLEAPGRAPAPVLLCPAPSRSLRTASTAHGTLCSRGHSEGRRGPGAHPPHCPQCPSPS